MAPSYLDIEGSDITPSVCPFCGAGCGVYLQRNEQGLVQTLPSRHDKISEGRLCMRGWQIGGLLRNSQRLGHCMIRGGRASWDDTIETTARLLQPLVQDDPDRIGVMAAAHLTNEEGFAIRHFARNVLGTDNIDNFGRAVDGPTLWGIQSVHNHPYVRPPLSDLVDFDVIISLSSALGHLNAQACAWVCKAQQQGTKLAVIDEIDDGLGAVADMFLHTGPWAVPPVIQQLTAALRNGDFDEKNVADIGHEGILEQFNGLVEAINDTNRVAVVVPTRAFSTPNIGLVAAELGHMLVMEKEYERAEVFAVTGTLNTVGLWNMGVVPPEPRDSGEGMSCVWEMLDLTKPELRGLVVFGEELMSWLDRDGLAELRDMLDVLVVVGSFRTAGGMIADTAMPMAGYGEHEGSFTTLEGLVRYTGKIMPPYSQSRYLPEVLADLGEQMNRPAGPRTLEDIWNSIRREVIGYEDVSFEQVKEELEVNLGATLPTFGSGSPADVQYSPIEVASPEEWQYILVQRYDQHWWIYDGRMWALPILYREMRDWREPHVFMNGEDMRDEEIRPGSPVIVETAKGRAELVAWEHPGLSQGLLVIPGHEVHVGKQLLGPGSYDLRSCSLEYRPTAAKLRRG
ncbi:MAG: molybdopterin oxidoreductase family protein [Armatimonadota bacterium]